MQKIPYKINNTLSKWKKKSIFPSNKFGDQEQKTHKHQHRIHQTNEWGTTTMMNTRANMRFLGKTFQGGVIYDDFI